MKLLVIFLTTCLFASCKQPNSLVLDGDIVAGAGAGGKNVSCIANTETSTIQCHDFQGQSYSVYFDDGALKILVKAYIQQTSEEYAEELRQKMREMGQPTKKMKFNPKRASLEETTITTSAPIIFMSGECYTIDGQKVCFDKNCGMLKKDSNSDISFWDPDQQRTRWFHALAFRCVEKQ